MIAWLEGLLNVLFPQRNICHACGAPLTAGEGLLCETCQAGLNALAFAHGRAETVVDENIDLAASAFTYDGVAARLMKALKFSADHAAAQPLAQGMALVMAQLPAYFAADICVPVPVHYKRLRRRGYNQSQVLAEALSALTGIPVSKSALVRIHHKHSQVGQGREGRLANIRNAFAVSTAARLSVRGQRVLVVDDVLTTGATAMECARVLREAGAEAVLLLTACRV